MPYIVQEYIIDVAMNLELKLLREKARVEIKVVQSDSLGVFITFKPILLIFATRRKKL